MEKKISFPMGNGMVKNGFYDPTTIPAKIQAKKNATAVATKIRLAEQGFQAKQVSTKSNEPVQSTAFKNGNRNS
tara:strand:- start:4995 stop:5216 length:222 start_codon:yes stop_codon:yes gene_type:complete